MESSREIPQVCTVGPPAESHARSRGRTSAWLRSPSRPTGSNSRTRRVILRIGSITTRSDRRRRNDTARSPLGRVRRRRRWTGDQPRQSQRALPHLVARRSHSGAASDRRDRSSEQRTLSTALHSLFVWRRVAAADRDRRRTRSNDLLARRPPVRISRPHRSTIQPLRACSLSPHPGAHQSIERRITKGALNGWRGSTARPSCSVPPKGSAR